MIRLIYTLLLFPLFLLASYPSSLSKEEKIWLDAQKEITVGAMDSWAPFNFINYKGESSGIGADIIRALNLRLNGKLKIISNDWSTTYQKAHKGELQAIMDITPKPEREPYFYFTQPYLQVPHVIVSRKNQPAFTSLKTLEGKRVALEKDIGTITDLKKNFPSITIQTYANTSECLDALSRAEVDAYVGNRAVVTYAMAQEMLDNIKIDALDTTRKGSPLSIGISKKFPLLYSILQKTMDDLSANELNEIFSKWSQEKWIDIGLTPEEKTYLRTKKTLHFVAADEAWAPFLFPVEKGGHEGLEIDFIHLLESKLKIPIEISYMPWPEAMKSAMAHRFDGIISASPTPERSKKLAFSNSYYLSPLALITTHDQPYNNTLKDFPGKSIAITEGSALESIVKQARPDLEIISSKEGTLAAIEMVLNKKADAVFDYLPPLMYDIEKNDLQNQLQVTLKLYSEDMSSFQYALRNDEPSLLSIINKAINAYTEEEKKTIRDRFEGKQSQLAHQSNNQIPLVLTEEEKQWIQAHPTITVANEPDWPPFDFTQDGQASGLGIDYVNLIAQKTGLKVNYIHAPWEKLLSLFKEGKIDLLHSVNRTSERDEYASFTHPFYTSYTAMAVRKDSDIRNLEELKGKKVAILKGYGTSEKLLKIIPDIQPIMVTNLDEALRAVSFGEADAVVDNMGAMGYVLMELTLTNLRITKAILPNDEENLKLFFATRKNQPILKSIIDKGLDAISPKEHAAIRSSWILQTEVTPQPIKPAEAIINLTAEEKEWLKAHPLIRFTSDPNHLPFEAFKKDGTFIGIVADHLKIIEDRLDIKFEKVISHNWSDVLKKAKNDEVDFISGYTNNEPLRETHTSTNSYIKSPIVIVMQKNKKNHFIVDLEELKDDKIAVMKDYGYLSEIYKQYPHHHFVEVENIEIAMGGVASGEYDALLCSLTLATYSISNMGLYNLHIAGKTDTIMEMSFNVKKDWEIFTTILNKALNSITPQESKEINEHWVSVHTQAPIDFSLILEILGVIISALIALFYWNYLLKKQVANKTFELSTLLKTFDAHVIASKTDLAGNITYASDAFCKISGQNREDILGKNHRISRHPDNDPAIYKAMWDIITHGGIWQGRIKNRTKDGGYYWVDSIIEQDRDHNGKIIGYTSIRHDVTAQVALEELSSKLESMIKERTRELASLNQEQQALFDAAPVGIVLIKNRIILSCNHHADEMFGYAIDEQIGQTTRMWYQSNEAWIEGGKHVEELLLEHNLHEREQELKRKDGTLFWARITLKLIDEKTLDKGVVGVIEDITLERKVREEIKHAQLLAEEATKVKSDFLANMSHEIRTPMNAIIGMSHLTLQTDLSAKQRNYIEKIDTASKHLLGIINDILDFSKIEAGKMSFENIPFYLEDVMENLADLSVIKAQEKGIELLFDVGTDVPTALVGDPLRLGQILINLVNNAIKFTPQGEIKISIQVESQKDKNVTLHFDIKDTGIGMSQEQQEKLFQAFSQADISTTRKYGGSGLGLAICKNLVEMMHGTLSVISDLGEGSTFSFNATFALQEQQTQLHFKDDDVKKLRILIVDDNASAREILYNILTSFKFEATMVNDGYQAIQELKKAHQEGNPYGLVLMDWMMPEMDGIETIKKIREDSDLDKTVAFIMITAYSKDEISAQLEDTNINGILIKPVSPSTLLNTILNTLGKEVVQHTRKNEKKVRLQQAEKSLSGASILLVEDNVVNQEMAQEILESAGIHVEIANNGLEAISKVMENRYDGVLMDCQMPIMDGFEATKAIRQQERFATLPILAMTANAMAGDKEKCLECGMNDHIAKPIDVKQLFLTMEKWIHPSFPAHHETKPRTQSAEEIEPFEIEGIDMHDALNRVGNNQQFLSTMLTRFSQSQADAIQRLRKALNGNDIQSAMLEAHTLKGVSGNIGATTLSHNAAEIEHLLKEGKTDQLEALLTQTEAMLQKIVEQVIQKDAKTIPEANDQTPPDVEKMDSQMLTHKFSKLNALLSALDSEASELLEELMDQLKLLGYQSQAVEMKKYVENFEFELAQKVLSDISNALHLELQED